MKNEIFHTNCKNGMVNKMIKFRDLPKLIDFGNYTVEIQLDYFNKTIEKYIERYELQLNPDFQRGHVWKKKQQLAFVEFVYSGGHSPPILFNHANWMASFVGDMVVVDGLQRITALMLFGENKFKIFGKYYFKDITAIGLANGITIYINNLKTRQEVLTWYIQLNSAGTPHTKKEIQRVKDLRKSIK